MVRSGQEEAEYHVDSLSKPQAHNREANCHNRKMLEKRTPKRIFLQTVALLTLMTSLERAGCIIPSGKFSSSNQLPNSGKLPLMLL